MNLEDFIRELSPELQEEARKCGSIEELLELAAEKKVPLPDEALEAIAGGTGAEADGCGSSKPKCPECGSKNTVFLYKTERELGWLLRYRCNNCKYEWDKFVYYPH